MSHNLVNVDYTQLQAKRAAMIRLVDFIAYADGKTDLIDISNKILVPIGELIRVVKKLKDNNVIK